METDGRMTTDSMPAASMAAASAELMYPLSTAIVVMTTTRGSPVADMTARARRCRGLRARR